MMNARAALLVLALILSPLPAGIATAQAPADPPDIALDEAARAAVIDGLLEKIGRIYVFPDMAKAMERAIRDRQARKEYDAVTSGREFARILTAHLREVCKDGHLDVEYSAAVIPEDPGRRPPDPGDVARFREAGRRRNYEYRKVERLDGGVGLLQVDGFYPGEWAGDTVAAAASFLANSEAIILDLRQNGGGAPTGVALLASYFFDEETHLEDQFNRAENATRQYWTYPVVPGRKLANQDLYILTSGRTFSAPESLAYDLRALGRATIVGETTGGGAHGTTPHRISDHFRASIPFSRSINPVTGTDWEGIGVKPDVAVPADQALLTAHLLALKKARTRHADDPGLAGDLDRAIAGKTSELNELKASRAGPR
ncbi:carboxy-terminal protease [Aquisphaera giovannonii]|uniref:Carboxy-terminal protease n=1 Tax=Aquisphaera giovannonii TaxID=406548 RepID=A0A5B9W5X7_9BACT|nr:S41 family peptidase [Aquisphaera giovannonii]QEH35380.1 carboxy-terminal protease [Aquisphaera giovannonii]